MCRGVRVEYSLTTRVRDARDLSARKLHRLDHVGCVACDNDFDARLKELIQTGPFIRHDRHAAGCRFKGKRGTPYSSRIRSMSLRRRARMASIRPFNSACPRLTPTPIS